MVMNPKRQHGAVCFTLDVLTDGSEYTGHGTIFLSVWKKPKRLHNNRNHHNHDWLLESMDMYAPLSRYAIAGIGDLTARLCADQRFKLSSTRGVFLPSPDCFDGLSALLLALYSAGAPSLHLVSTQCNTMEELANIVLGPRRNLQISNCQVPGGELSPRSEIKTLDWWLVYQDDYLIVHASRRDARDLDQVTYLFTMCSSGEPSSTLAVLPPHCSCLRQAYDELLQAELPILPNDNNTHIQIHTVLALNAQGDQGWLTSDRDLKIPLLVTSQDMVRSIADPGILIRSQKITQFLSKQLPNQFPKATALPNVLPMLAWERNFLHLQSCTSIVFDLATPTTPTVVLDRRQTIWERPLSDEFQSTIESLQNFPTSSMETSNQQIDQNEIDLDLDNESANDDDDNNNTNAEGPVVPPHPSLCDNGPKLFVLGTGCATPSAIRGASGYALTFPTNDPSKQSIETFILDCGEGVTTMLSRYGPDDWRQSIQGIWISHAHLDHFGGLPTLIRTIAKLSDEHDLSTVVEPASQSDTTARSSNHHDHHDGESTLKRQKTIHATTPPVCWVMAPPKVLRYLDLCLGCHHGRRITDGRQFFDPRLPHDPTIPPGPWTNFHNIRVLHNCHPAYGLLLGWNPRSRTIQPFPAVPGSTDSRHDKVWLCFSGDTRPSETLMRTCQTMIHSGASHRHHWPTSLFLLHEATFEDAEQGQANQKKHSTVGEALQVANKIGATKVLLTHFSQRYVSLQNVASPWLHSIPTIPVGLAMDGLCLSLE